jgi:transglutaminase-like putative cysteine protease
MRSDAGCAATLRIWPSPFADVNIPARYCAGYLGDIGVPPASAPVWISPAVRGADGQWYAFDPRNNGRASAIY